jgi:hypothetical protein
VLDLKIDALKKLAVDLKLYKEEGDVDLTAPKLKATIIQILGSAKSISYDEDSGSISVDEFEPQSFAKPAQSSPN